jgi:ankyrin repeat protein
MLISKSFYRHLPIFLNLFKCPLRGLICQSFAEFFLAQSSFNKIEQGKDTDKELEQILRDQRHFLIRRFLNDIMEKQPQSQKPQQQTSENDFKQEIENCCRENLISLLSYFIEQKQANLKPKNEFLILASANGHKVIVQILLDHKDIDINQIDIKEYNALMWASDRGHNDIVHILLQHKEINTNQKDMEYGRTAFFLCISKWSQGNCSNVIRNYGHRYKSTR